jgi:hypothetical protein
MELSSETLTDPCIGISRNLKPNQVGLIKFNILPDDGSGIILRSFRLTIGDAGWKHKVLVDLNFLPTWLYIYFL